MNPIVQFFQWVLDVFHSTAAWLAKLNAVEMTVVIFTIIVLLTVLEKAWGLLKDQFPRKKEVRRRFLARRDRSRINWPGEFRPRERLKKRK